MRLKLHVWRQESSVSAGKFETYEVEHLSPNMSFLEMLDTLNEQLAKSGQRPVEFESDCREGICGTCGLMISGQAHGPRRKAATCQLYLRDFEDGEEITIEPWRASAFPVIKDLAVDRSALNRILAAGGYVSVKTGPHMDANATLIPKDDAETALDAATCIQCGACVAACPNASASLFTAALVSRYAMLPQGQVEAPVRVKRLVAQMDEEGFGHCTNIGECQAACPKNISVEMIHRMRREWMRAMVTHTERITDVHDSA